MPLPESNESLSDACRRLYPYAADFRARLVPEDRPMSDVNEHTRNAVVALDAFIAACRAGGLAG